MTRKRLVLVLALVPVLALLGLFGWATLRVQGSPVGGIAINARFGEVPPSKATPADFTLELFDGGRLSLSQLRGRNAMIDFWATWCPPCRQEAPTLARVWEEYRGKGVVFVGIDLWDAEEEAKRFIARYGLTYANGPDRTGAIAVDFGVTGLPEKFFLDREGRVVKKFIGPVTEDRLRRTLDELLAGE